MNFGTKWAQMLGECDKDTAFSMMDYFYEIFMAYKQRDTGSGEIDFRSMAWSQQYVKPGELGFDTSRRDRVTRYDWVRQWAHLHPRVKVVGVFDTVGSYKMSGWVQQPGQDTDWHASKLHPSMFARGLHLKTC